MFRIAKSKVVPSGSLELVSNLPFATLQYRGAKYRIDIPKHRCFPKEYHSFSHVVSQVSIVLKLEETWRR